MRPASGEANAMLQRNFVGVVSEREKV